MRLVLAVVVAVFFGVGGAFGAGVPLMIFWEPTAAAAVVGGTIAVLAASFPPATIGAAFRGDGGLEGTEILNLGRRTAWYLGLACFVTGAVAVLYALDDPAAIGPSLAMALLSVLYAVILGEGVFGTVLAGRGRQVG